MTPAMFEPRTAAELFAHYKQVRLRTNPPPPAPPPAPVQLELPLPVPADAQKKIENAEVQSTRQRELAIRILRDVCAAYGVESGELMSGSKRLQYAEARLHLYYLLRIHTDWSSPHIGKFLNRDHSSVLHGCNLYAKQIGANVPVTSMSGGDYVGL